MTLNSDFQKLYVDGLITLFELDARALGAGILRFHGHISYEDWERLTIAVSDSNSTHSVELDAQPKVISEESLLLASADSEFNFAFGEETPSTDSSHVDSKIVPYGDFGKVWAWNRTTKEWKQNIIWQGEIFEPMALEVSGLEMRSDGKASAPTLSMANNINGIQNAVSAYCLQFKDFAGAKLKVITTLAKYLDAENFTAGNPTASNESKEQIWYIEQKTSENAQQVTFELSNPIDFEGLKIPVRQITSLCHWCMVGKYRGEECGYTGVAMFTDKDEPTDNPALDRCGGRLRSCRLRFGENKPLPFGGFPTSSLL
ncbi:lambda-like phage minor tail protein L [Acinetobacter baumannii]|uniref:phage minor tail protein L n=1 Tax=Acinetobacter baumannii TaxID=470 RepID=UPI000DE69B8A|nr:phage minor tail protein L [Acinetobacter baumannii]SSQ04247.1 lambda-like phage minor tail protein L [Acinetobacter baumannii]